MRSAFTAFFALGICVGSTGQVPFECTRISGGPYSSGSHILYNSECVVSPGIIPVPTLFDQQANVEFKSGKNIKLLPGFKAGNFTTGHFLAHIEEPALNAFIYAPVNYHPINNPILKYNKFEIGIELPQDIQNQVNDFIAGNDGINPYDPDQIKIQVDFQEQITGNTYTRYGFYYQDVTVSGNGWITNTNTLHPFRVRFAPPQDGFWYAHIKLFVNNTLVGNPFVANFIVNPSSNKGHLLASQNTSTLRFENGSPFFGIGRNIAFADDAYTGTGNATPSGFQEQRGFISHWSDNGGNFVRLRMDAWSNAIEWESTVCGNYQNRQMHAWELDNTLFLCENIGIYLLLCLQSDAELSVWHGEDQADNKLFYSWGAINQPFHPNNNLALNPYYHLLGGPQVDPSPELFLSSIQAKEFFKRRLFYIISRWGYSSNISIWELMNETDNFGRYGQASSEALYNLTSVQQLVKDWHCEMSQYLYSFYPIHLVTSGYTGGGPKANDKSEECPYITVLTANSYGIDPTINSESRFDLKCNLYNNQYRCSVFPHFNARPRPFILGEIGLGNNCFFCLDNDFHNASWATSFMGHLGSGLHWWDWENRYFVHNIDLLPLKSFIAQIDFENHTFKANSRISNNFSENKSLETIYLLNSDASIGYGWIHNLSYYWLNVPENCDIQSCAPTYSQGTPYVIYEQSDNPKVEIENLDVFRNYDFEFFSTRIPNDFIGSIGNEAANLSGVVKFRYKLNDRLDFVENEFPDVAFKLTKNAVNRMTSDTLWLPNDTNIYTTQPFPFNPISSLDTTIFQIFWDFGFGLVSTQPAPSPIFPGPGVYTITLRITDSLSHSKWIIQNFVFIDGTKSSAFRYDGVLPFSNTGIIYQNPVRDIIEFSSNNFDSFTIYTPIGMKVCEGKIVDESTTLNISTLANGLYYLSLRSLTGRSNSSCFIKQ